jgi:double-stranded uracil-DNA glycosylase
MATDLAILDAPLAAPAPEPERLVDAPRLPDVLRDNLDVVFVGTAAGRRAAEIGVYYAHPGNYFWRTLWHVGLTPRRFAPQDFAKLRDVGIGFTDLSKSGCGMDHEIAAETFDLAAFEAKMRQHQPRAVAFTSKKAASLWLHRRTDRIAYGRQKRRPEIPFEVFVLPSPSAAARRYWRLEPWHELADWLRATRPWRF